MGGEVHEDEGCLFIRDVESLGVGRGLPMTDVVLNFTVVQNRYEPFNEEDLVPHGGVGVC